MNHITKNHIRQLAACALITATAFSLAACRRTTIQTQAPELTKELKAETVENRTMDESFRSAAADFSIQLFQQDIAMNNTGSNILISPESVLFALGMTANGANGTTLAEMEQVLCGGMDIQDFNEYMYTYNNGLVETEDVTFHLANSVWIKDNPAELQVNADFLQTDKTYYNADAFLADFDETTVSDINHWVDTNTNGMIHQLLEEIPADAVMYLINALAFEGAWETKYEQDQINENGRFTSYQGVEETVAMLNSTESQYITGEHVSGFVKNYEGGDYAFLALLPEEGTNVADYIASMDGEAFLELYDNRSYQDVLVQIPEFSYDYDTELKEALSRMGMADAFSEAADFSRMAQTDTGLLYISRVLHKTHIEVDRAGTKAAAVTAVEMKNEAAMLEPEETPTVYLNRPFVYAIVDTETGLPIFLGTVNTI